MLVMRIFLNYIVIESNWGIRTVFCFSRKNNFIYLFIGIEIKLHFRLESPFTNFFLSENLIFLQIYLYHKLLRKRKYHQELSFMKIKNKRVPNTDSCGTPEFIFLQSDVWPFNTTLC